MIRQYLKLTLSLLIIPLVCFAQGNSSVPRDWQKINANDSFTFYLPSDMKRAEDVRGIDSYVEEYRNDNLHVQFDYGMYSDRLRGYSDKPDFRRIETRISGRKARIVTFYDPEARDGLKHAAGVHFPERGRRIGGLTMWANCKTPVGQDIAKKIFRSIRFPKVRGTSNNSFNRSGISLDFIDNLYAIRRYFPPG